MVAGILEKLKRLRKALFFIVKKLPISRAAEGRAQTAECGALARRGICVKNEPYVEPEKPGNLDRHHKTRQGICGDSRSRRRQPRRFANLDLNSFAPVLRPVPAPPACGAARPKLHSRASLALE